MRDPNRPTYSKWSRRKGGNKICPQCGHRHPLVMRIDGRSQRPKVCVRCGTELPAVTFGKRTSVQWYVRKFDPQTGQNHDGAMPSSEACDDYIAQQERAWTPSLIQQQLTEQVLAFIHGITATTLEEGVVTLVQRLGGDTSGMVIKPIGWDQAVKTITDEMLQVGISAGYVNSMIRMLGYFRQLTGLDAWAAVTKESIIKYRGARLAGGWQHAGRTVRATSGRSINKELAMLAAFMARVVKKRWMPRNPFEGGDSEHVKVPSKRVEYMPDADLRRLIELADTTWLRTLVIVAYYTGSRKSDLLQLEWDRDLDLDGTRAVAEGRQGPHIFIRGQKADTPHWVPLHPAAVTALRALRSEPFIGKLVFPIRSSQPGTKVSVLFTRLCRRAGLMSQRTRPDGTVVNCGRWVFHDLRRKANTDLRNSGASPKERAALLGHKSISVNEQHYEAIIPSRERELMDGLPVFGLSA